MLALVLTVAGSTAAYAKGGDHHHHPDPPSHDPRQAPEVDPNLAIGGFTLLAGSLTVIRARRKK